MTYERALILYSSYQSTKVAESTACQTQNSAKIQVPPNYKNDQKLLPKTPSKYHVT